MTGKSQMLWFLRRWLQTAAPEEAFAIKITIAALEKDEPVHRDTVRLRYAAHQRSARSRGEIG
jgi:hypothetical protein